MELRDSLKREDERDWKEEEDEVRGVEGGRALLSSKTANEWENVTGDSGEEMLDKEEEREEEEDRISLSHEKRKRELLLAFHWPFSSSDVLWMFRRSILKYFNTL